MQRRRLQSGAGTAGTRLISGIRYGRWTEPTLQHSILRRARECSGISSITFCYNALILSLKCQIDFFGD